MAAPEELIPLTVSSENQGATASKIRLASAEDSCLTPEVQQEGAPRFGDSGSPASNQDEQPQEVIQQMMISDEKTEGEKVEECLKKLEENGMKWKTFVIAIICIAMKLPDVWYSEALKYQAAMPQNSTMQCDNASNKSNWGEESKSSVVMEFQICDNESSYLRLHLYADIGVIAGSIFWTFVMDQFGRKKPFLICSVTMAVLGIVNAALHDYTMYSWMRGGIGFFRPGFELAGFLLAVELFSAKKRAMAATLIEQFWGIGMMMLGELMMMVPNWRHLQMITAVAGLVTSPLIGYVNESIPWLFSRGRDKDVDKIMKRATKGNKNNNSNNDDDDDDNNSSHHNNNSSINNNNNSCSSCKCMSASCLYCHCQGRRKIGPCQILIICSMTLLWFITSWMYYGTSQKMTDMMDTVPMNLMLGGTMELIACSLCFFIIKNELSMCFVTLAKILITASFGIVHLYAVEIFPTNVRAQCMSFTIVGSALGHIAATCVPMQVTLFFGSVLLLMSGIFFGVFVQLPETNKKPLPQNLQEMQKLERLVLYKKLKTNIKNRKSCCSSRTRERDGDETAVNNQNRNSTTKDSKV